MVNWHRTSTRKWHNLVKITYGANGVHSDVGAGKLIRSSLCKANNTGKTYGSVNLTKKSRICHVWRYSRCLWGGIFSWSGTRSNTSNCQSKLLATIKRTRPPNTINHVPDAVAIMEPPECSFPPLPVICIASAPCLMARKTLRKSQIRKLNIAERELKRLSEDRISWTYLRVLIFIIRMKLSAVSFLIWSPDATPAFAKNTSNRPNDFIASSIMPRTSSSEAASTLRAKHLTEGYFFWIVSASSSRLSVERSVTYIATGDCLAMAIAEARLRARSRYQ